MNEPKYNQGDRTRKTPKYSQGDRAGIWKIASVNYGGKQFGCIYELVRFEGTRKVGLTCTEKILENYLNNLQTA